MRRLIVLFASSVLSILSVLPASAASNSRTTTAARSIPHTDSQIDATIRTKLAKSKIGKDGFHFHVQRGVVTWEGKTNVIQHKGSATRMAKAAGATQVINNIQISDSARSKATANLKHASVVQ